MINQTGGFNIGRLQNGEFLPVVNNVKLEIPYPGNNEYLPKRVAQTVYGVIDD
ncbi:hypothetical protein FACS189483_07110 [Spirochaetia bacterium]|nr:hypothetical protein FACS189483_07110 [Spirochaetia bacterium]